MTASPAEHSHSAAPKANADLRAAVRAATLAPERDRIAALKQSAALSEADRTAISTDAARLVESVRSSTEPTVMESFLAEYGLSTKEGIALMCLAEALLRVPDTPTIDALIEDKIVPGEWGQHLGHSSSSLVNASTWALMLTGGVLRPGEQQGLVTALRGAVRRLGEPVVRTATGQAMIELGRQFVLGRSIEEAMKRGAGMEAKGYTYSFDMLGEAARTEADARRYHLAYSDAITAIAPACGSTDIRENPGISVKLSALHARYEFPQKKRVMSELTARARSLALLAKSANMGFNIDAEEADRLDLSLDVIEAVLSDEALAGWDGFGVVVQAFGPRAEPVLHWLHDLAVRLDRRIMVRLVKGAYWDTEIKRAQTLGLDGYPVFTRKANTDVSYIACARTLLGMTDRIYPQFATHNAHTAAAILHMAGRDRDGFEFQRLHGMGESLHDTVKQEYATRCRIYAPVGKHKDLLAYLVRRLLENGANSSFVNQIVDTSVPAETVAADPFPQAGTANPRIPKPVALYGPARRNARGWDHTDPVDVAALDTARSAFDTATWHAGPTHGSDRDGRDVVNPADPDDIVGRVVEAGAAEVEDAILRARGPGRRGRRGQRQRIRPHLRPAHPRRLPGAAGGRPRQGRQSLRQPQSDRCHRRLPALRRRGPVRHRPQGRRPALPVPLPLCRRDAGSSGGFRTHAGRRRPLPSGGVGHRCPVAARRRPGPQRSLLRARRRRGGRRPDARTAGTDRREQPLQRASPRPDPVPRPKRGGGARPGDPGPGHGQPGRGRRPRCGRRAGRSQGPGTGARHRRRNRRSRRPGNSPGHRRCGLGRRPRDNPPPRPSPGKARRPPTDGDRRPDRSGTLRA
jgi:proline dehydrogenase